MGSMHSTRLIWLIVFTVSLVMPQTIKIACIGNSITAGNAQVVSYPARIQKLLGTTYRVENDGVSGLTLLKKGDKPYWKSGKLTQIFAFQPSIVTIKLGTNDSKPINWIYKAEFETDLKALIDTLEKNISPKPTIWLCLPAPAWPINGVNNYGIDGKIVKNEIIPIIQKVAVDRNLKTIDLQTVLTSMQSHFPDGVHPDSIGQDTIAANVYRALTAATLVKTGLKINAKPYMYMYNQSLRVEIPSEMSASVQLNTIKGELLDNDGQISRYPNVYEFNSLPVNVYMLSIQYEHGSVSYPFLVK